MRSADVSKVIHRDHESVTPRVCLFTSAEIVPNTQMSSRGKLTAYKKSRVDQRQFMLKLFQAGNRNGKEMYELMTEKFKGDPALASVKTVYHWLARFKMGEFDVEDRPRCGRPVVKTEDSRIREVLERDPYASVTDLYCELDLPRNSCKTTLARAGLVNVNIMWVPKEITETHREMRIAHSLNMVQREEKEPFLHRVIFTGEKYITYNKHKTHFKRKDAKKVRHLVDHPVTVHKSHLLTPFSGTPANGISISQIRHEASQSHLTRLVDHAGNDYVQAAG